MDNIVSVNRCLDIHLLKGIKYLCSIGMTQNNRYFK